MDAAVASSDALFATFLLILPAATRSSRITTAIFSNQVIFTFCTSLARAFDTPLLSCASLLLVSAASLLAYARAAALLLVLIALQDALRILSPTRVPFGTTWRVVRATGIRRNALFPTLFLPFLASC